MDKSGVFYIDLFDSSPIVSEYEVEALNENIKEHDVSDASELDDFDWKVFKDPKQAHNFLATYLHVRNHVLPNYVGCKNKGLPQLLYKRRYLIQSLMGVKSFTVRDYKKEWKSGQLVNIHDQRHFITVQIQQISKVDGGWRYDFRVIF